MPSTFAAPTPQSASFYVNVKRGTDPTQKWYLASSTGYHLYGKIQELVTRRVSTDRAITAADLRTVATGIRGSGPPFLTGVPADKKAAMATALSLAADAGRMTPRAMAILLWIALRDDATIVGTEALLPAELGVPETAVFPDLGAAPALPQGSGPGANDITFAGSAANDPIVTADGVLVNTPQDVNGTPPTGLPGQAKSWMEKYGLWLVVGAGVLVTLGVVIALVVANKNAKEREAQKRIVPGRPPRAELPASTARASDGTVMHPTGRPGFTVPARPL